MKRTIPVSDANHRRIADRAYPRSRPGEQVAPHFNDVVGEALDLLDKKDADAAEKARVAQAAAEVYAKPAPPRKWANGDRVKLRNDAESLLVDLFGVVGTVFGAVDAHDFVCVRWDNGTEGRAYRSSDLVCVCTDGATCSCGGAR